MMYFGIMFICIWNVTTTIGLRPPPPSAIKLERITQVVFLQMYIIYDCRNLMLSPHLNSFGAFHLFPYSHTIPTETTSSPEICRTVEA